MDALDCLRIVAVDKDGEHHGFRPCFGDEVVDQIKHELWLVASTGKHGDQVCIANIGNTLVSYNSIPLLRHKVVNQLVHA
jgi:hypothetical protein